MCALLIKKQLRVGMRGDVLFHRAAKGGRRERGTPFEAVFIVKRKKALSGLRQ